MPAAPPAGRRPLRPRPASAPRARARGAPQTAPPAHRTSRPQLPTRAGAARRRAARGQPAAPDWRAAARPWAGASAAGPPPAPRCGVGPWHRRPGSRGPVKSPCAAPGSSAPGKSAINAQTAAP
uniref:Uncharacterized protein n=1 Tax=Tanacetum cinerariifolium TaxID=118510 RepID=A0A699WGY3_TANCI|nr:hypothetical protein [Tanacetum cinerariifolium]